jgi:hypothetical protein
MDDAAAPPIPFLASQIEMLDAATLEPFAQNSRAHSESQIEALIEAIRFYGFTIPLLVRPDRKGLIAGHGRLAAGLRLGMTQFPALVVPADWTEEMIRAYVVWDNRSAELASWDLPVLKLELGSLSAAGFDLSLTGFSLDSLPVLDLNVGAGLPGGGGQPHTPSPGSGSLADRFGVPPFSVLNAREGWWQNRKRAWIALGIKSELGRGEGATYGAGEEITEPGLNHYRNKAKAFDDGTVKGAGRGGLSDQLAGTLKGGRKAKAGAA